MASLLYVNGDPVNLVDPNGHRACADQDCYQFTMPQSSTKNKQLGSDTKVSQENAAEINYYLYPQRKMNTDLATAREWAREDLQQRHACGMEFGPCYGQILQNDFVPGACDNLLLCVYEHAVIRAGGCFVGCGFISFQDGHVTASGTWCCGAAAIAPALGWSSLPPDQRRDRSATAGYGEGVGVSGTVGLVPAQSGRTFADFRDWEVDLVFGAGTWVSYDQRSAGFQWLPAAPESGPSP